MLVSTNAQENMVATRGIIHVTGDHQIRIFDSFFTVTGLLCGSGF